MHIETLKSDLLFFCATATASLCLGLLFNQLRDQPFPLYYQSKKIRLEEAIERLSTETAAVAISSGPSLPKTLTVEDVASYIFEGKGLILDARPDIFYRLGRIPGALSLPREDFESAYQTLKERLEVNRAQPIVVYCSSASCEDATLLRDGLEKLGYTNLSIFTGGWAEWTRAEKPEERN